MNEKPFELFGLTSEDYITWCKENKKKQNDPETKKEFFEKVRHYEIFKKNGNLVEITKEEK